MDKKCIECATEMPNTASKCNKCGSYQDWRRYLSLSQSSIAIVIALIALSGHFVGGGQAIIESVSSFLNRSNFSTRVGIVDINEDKASILVTSLVDNTIAITSLSCILYVLIDSTQNARDRLAEREIGSSKNTQFPKRSETIGVFLITYNIDSEAVLQSGDQRIISATRNLVGPPTDGISTEDDEVKSYCLLGGVDQENNIVSSITALRPTDMNKFDIVEMLKYANYSEEYEYKRMELLDIVSQINSQG